MNLVAIYMKEKGDLEIFYKKSDKALKRMNLICNLIHA